MEVNIILVILIGIVMFVSGFLIEKTRQKSNNVGTLRIDRSDPDKPPYFFLEVTNVRRIKNGKTITMTVNEENYISQE